jgi:ABC-type sugar transport system ATPase subunit
MDPQKTFAITCSGVGKSYGALTALHPIDLGVATGSVHALVGENGAGKSTLLRILAGEVRPDHGRITVLDAPLPIGNPKRVLRQGVLLMRQEVTLVPGLSVAENCSLPHVEAGASRLRRRAAARTAFTTAAASLGVAIDPDSLPGELSLAQQRTVELIKATLAGARVLLLDEPSAALGPMERTQLHGLVRRLRDEGCTVVLVSHDLDEVLDLSDEVTVLRDGQVVLRSATVGLSREALLSAMAGHQVTTASGDRAAPDASEVLRVAGLTVPGSVRDGHIALRAGEIVLLAGLAGAGRSELLWALAGAGPGQAERVELDGRAVGLPRSTRAALRTRIALLPEERAAQGMVASMTAAENAVLSDTRRASGGVVLRRRRQLAAATDLAGRVGFSVARLAAPMATLSGGNQQKILIARCLYVEPRVLLLDEPTRGIDVRTKGEIMRSIRRYVAESGAAALVVSSEVEELLEFCDRVLVLGQDSRLRPVVGEPTSAAILSLAFTGSVAA